MATSSVSELCRENERLRAENFRLSQRIRHAEIEEQIADFDRRRAELRQRYDEGTGEFAPMPWDRR